MCIKYIFIHKTSYWWHTAHVSTIWSHGNRLHYISGFLVERTLAAGKRLTNATKASLHHMILHCVTSWHSRTVILDLSWACPAFSMHIVAWLLSIGIKSGSSVTNAYWSKLYGQWLGQHVARTVIADAKPAA